MSRTTTALKRLGVTSLAAVTIGAGVPVFFATAASANHVSTITLTPDTATAAAGTCTEFVAQISPVTQNVVVDVNLSPRNNTDQSFCRLNAAGTAQTTDPNLVNSNPAGVGVVDNAEFLTDANGQVRFGVISASTGVIDVTAFVEEDATATDNGTVAGTEPNDTSVLTITGGSDQDVTTVDAEPETGTVTTGQPVNFTVKTTNSGGQPISGRQVYFDVTSGPNSAIGPVACGAPTTTDQTGTVTCSYTSGPGTGTDTIVAYINNSTATSPAPSPTALDAGDTQDTITRNLVAALAAGATVDLTCANGFNAGADTCQVPLSKTNQVLSALVKNAVGTAVSGAVVEFSFTNPSVPGSNTGQAGPEQTTTGANAEAADSLSPTTCVTDATGSCSTTLTNPSPRQGDTISVQALIRTGAATAVDNTNVIYRNPAANEARVLTLSPDAATTTVGNAQGLTVLVVDRFGNPVAGVAVTLTENGTGRFADGSSSIVRTTDANGQATADLVTTSIETPGSTTVTATIGTGAAPRNPGTADDECEQPANTSLFDANGGPTAAATGNQSGAVAGDCDDVSTVTFVANNQQSPTPTATATTTATATSTATATPPACRPVTVVINTKTINATGLASVSTVGAAPGSIVELQGYSQNHFLTATFANDPTPIDRSKAADSNGAATFSDIRPASNTRLRARMSGCTYAGNSDVINVRAQETLQVTRNGVRKYTFSGVSIPARPGGLIVSLYQITGTPCAAGVEPRNCPSERLIGQDRAEQGSSDSGAPAAYSITLTLPASYGSSARFVVKTGQDAQNAPGRSNARTLSIF